MGSSPLGGDDLPALKPAALRVSEAAPSPAPGPVRDALAAVTDARARRAEELLTAPLQAYLDRAIGLVRARLKGPKARKGTKWWDGAGSIETKALDPGYILPAKVTEELAEELPTAALRIATDAAADTASRLASGDEPDLGSFGSDEIAAAVEDAVSRLLGVADRHARELRAAILTADEEAEDLDEVFDRIEEAHRRGGNWVLMSGRTLANALANDAAYRQAMRLGVTHAQWISRRDERVRRTHAHPTGADGQVRRLGDRFQVGAFKLRFPGDPADLPASWGEIANCFVPETEVSGPDIEGSFRAPYIGEVVTVHTASGGVLTGTPNHPMLTERGWVSLGQLDQSDRMVNTRSADVITGQPEEQGAPTTVEQAHRALAQRGLTHGVPAGAVNFYGDRPAGEVDVVTLDGQLRIGAHAALGEQVSENDLPGRGKTRQSGASARLGGQLCLGSDASSAGVVSGCDQGGAANLVEVGPALDHGVRAPSWLYAAAQQAGPDGGPIHPERFAQSLLALASPVPADDLDVVDGDTQVADLATTGAHGDPGSLEAVEGGRGADPLISRHLVDGLAVAIQLDRVVKIERSWFRGHVYTLQATSGMYRTGYHIARNCRCGLLFRKPDKDTRRRLGRVFDAAADSRSPAAALDALDAALKRAAAAPDAPVLIPAPPGMGLPPVAALVTLGRDIVAYRMLARQIDAVPGQVITAPSALVLALAPAAATATALAVLLPAGAVVGVAAGAAGVGVILPEGATLEVLGAGVDGVRAVLTSETVPPQPAP